MVALDHVIVLNLLDHLNLVNTSLAIGSGGGSSDISEAGGGIRGSLTLGSGSQVLGRVPGGVISVVSMMVVTMGMVIVMVARVSASIEGEGVDQRLAVSVFHTPELTGAKDALAANSDDEKQLCIHVVSCVSLQVS